MSILDNKNAIPNKLINDDGSTTDLKGNTIASSTLAFKLKRALPNKVLNADGTYSKLSDIIGGGRWYIRLQCFSK